MGHSKQNKGQNKKDGNHRAETREEKQERLRKQEEARQACFKLMPYAGGAIVLFMLIFAIYVRNIPPKAPKPKVPPAGAATTTTTTTPKTQIPIDKERLLREALEKGDINLPEGMTIDFDSNPPIPGEAAGSSSENNAEGGIPADGAESEGAPAPPEGAENPANEHVEL